MEYKLYSLLFLSAYLNWGYLGKFRAETNCICFDDVDIVLLGDVRKCWFLFYVADVDDLVMSLLSS